MGLFPTFDFGNWGGTLLIAAVVLIVASYFLFTFWGFAVSAAIVLVLVVGLYYLGLAIDNWLRHGGPL